MPAVTLPGLWRSRQLHMVPLVELVVVEVIIRQKYDVMPEKTVCHVTAIKSVKPSCLTHVQETGVQRTSP